VCVGGGT